MENPTPDSRIRLLPEAVANQIAAGEVVERPASVLKELMENSLDAGAGRIAVEILAAGRRLIRVADDGAGMGPDDLLMALERHATSKVATSRDLEAVATLGFRGEALPSIAAVSRMLLRSRARGQEAGSEVKVVAGSVREVREIGCPPGTVIEVRDLFFNTPARRKFLKSAATENAHLQAVFTRLALAWPQVAFSLKMGNKTLHQLPPTPDLEVRAAALLGPETASQMVPLDEEVGPLRLRGLAGLPSLSRAGYEAVYTFVNGRFVRDRVLLHAVGQAYRGLMPPDRRPVVVLHLQLDPALVDVNVHPAKTEVRFTHQQQIHDALAQALRRGLGQTRAARTPAGDADAGPPPPPERTGEPGPSPPASNTQTPPSPAIPWRPAASYPLPGLAEPGPAAAAEAGTSLPPAALEPLFGPAGELHLVGQLHGLYLLCSSPRGLVIMDQHAAHERLRYDELKRNLRRGGLPCQGLLTPCTLELSPQEAAWAESQRRSWAHLGLVLEPFGGNTWAVRAVPPHLAGADPEPVVRGLLAELAQAGVRPETPEFVEVALRSLACRGSIKSGQRLSQQEAQDLIRRIAALPPPVTCPHGRPVMLTLSARELARRFKRSPKVDHE